MKRPAWTTKGAHIPPSVKRDAVLLPAFYLFNCFSFSAWTQLSEVATKPWLLLIWLYGLVTLVPLAWRDSAPMTIFATQWVFTVAAWQIMPHYPPIAGIPVALYAVSIHCSRKVSLLALLASFIPNALAAAVAFRVYDNPSEQFRSFIPNALFLFLMSGGAWAAGRLTGANKRHIQRLERESEAARQAEVLAAERRGLARELHDIVSHAVIVILLQAVGAARVADADFTQITETDFAKIRESLENIRTVGAQTMAELRRLLSVLETGNLASLSIDERAPQPGLADMAELLTSLRVAGMPVTVHVEGIPHDLDPSVDLAAYRIMQEGLTNVLKHAGKDSNPRLRLVWKPPSLLIQIDNYMDLAKEYSGPASPNGRGLVGLRERALAAGGDLVAGPQQGGGYRLTAILPTATPATPAGISSTTAPCASNQEHGDQGKVSV
jgi:signal transduction histidine kinase